MNGAASSESAPAVVIGVGIGGLLAAAALSQSFDHVVILERDTLPDGPRPRTGVAQSAQPHLLLVRGIQIFESLVPGFGAALIEAGAVVHHSSDWRLILSGGELAPVQNDLVTLGATRPTVEWVLRQQVMTLPNIELRSGVRVQGLECSRAGDRVTGVRLANHGATPDQMPASLVVDSSGRGSSVTTWLAEIGQAPVREEIVTCDVGYSSCFFHRPPDDATPSILIQPRSPDHPVLGELIAVEGNRWQLLLGGMAGHYPPIDLEGMLLAWARDLASPDIYDILRQTQPCARPRGFRVPSTRLRCFDQAPTWPAGLVVLGDAVAAFNPIYAQGMTVAAREALALRELAGVRSPGWEAAFQREVSRLAALPWAIGAGEDLRWTGVTLGGRPASRRQRLQNWYLDRVYAAATIDPVISQATIETINLLHDSPPFLHPRMMARVLRTRCGSRPDLDRTRPAPRAVLDRGVSS